ncbi:glucose-6-phosphate isomerase [Aureococcus anophagefferens]|nr:glucose-6-phosphate isomerase [Aureococcus anophagefferens]
MCSARSPRQLRALRCLSDSCSSQSPTRASRQFGNAPHRCAAAPTRPGTPCAHVAADIESTHLRDLLRDDARNAALTFACGDITLDCSRQRATVETLRLLAALGEARGVAAKRDAMLRGDLVNESEGRAALHAALRAPRGAAPVLVDGADVHAAIHDTLDRVYAFAGKVRAGGVGSTGKMLTNVVAIGIGGSCLGPECVYEALRSEPAARAAAAGRSLRFISNVDPVDAARVLDDSDPETTLFVVVSKSFATAETLLNAQVCRDWLVARLPGVNPAMAVAGHFCAVSSDVEKAADFGVEPDNVFGFGDYVGGRFSVHSPENLPVLLGLFGAYNSAVLGFPCRAVLPYAQALSRFPAHVQQLDMESNGKSVASDGSALAGDAGEIIFGEPGTNGQHSFYQLMHQGRTVPAEFIGFCESQRPAHAKGRR